MKTKPSPAIVTRTRDGILLSIKPIVAFMIACLQLVLASPTQAEIPIPTIVFGTNTNATRDASQQDIELNFNLAFAKFSTTNGVVTKLKVYNNQQALLAAFDQGHIDGIFSVVTDILPRENQLKPKMTAVVYANGQYKFSLMLVVRKADNISNIEQLQDKRLSMPQSHEIESLYLNTLLLKKNLAECEQFFSKVVKSPNSNTTVSDLFFNRVDAIIVNANEYQTATELNPQIAQKTIVIAQSEPLVLLAGALRSNIDDDIEKRLFNAAIGFNLTEAGNSLYKLLGMRTVRAIYPDDLDTMHSLQNGYAKLKNAKVLEAKQITSVPIKRLSNMQKLNQISNTASDKVP